MSCIIRFTLNFKSFTVFKTDFNVQAFALLFSNQMPKKPNCLRPIAACISVIRQFVPNVSLHIPETTVCIRLLQHIPVLPMVFILPCFFPELSVIGHDKAAFAARTNYFILTKGKGANMAKRTNRLLFIKSHHEPAHSLQ